jgi:hypothetical protein
MTGKWLLRAAGEEPPSHSRARIHLDGGATLHYRDPRLFGRLRLVPGARFEEVPEVAALGPDPLLDGIDVERLSAALARRRTPVKTALPDQALLLRPATSRPARRSSAPDRPAPRVELPRARRGEADRAGRARLGA